MQYQIHPRAISAPQDPKLTPDTVFLLLRNRFPGSVLLESTDYSEDGGSVSYIGFDPLASINLTGGVITERLPDGAVIERNIPGGTVLEEILCSFVDRFSCEKQPSLPASVINGFFGYIGYHAIPGIEKIELADNVPPKEQIPALAYTLFRHIISIDHASGIFTIIENQTDPDAPSRLPELLEILSRGQVEHYGFKREGDVTSNLTDERHTELIEQCKVHIRRGDVFQIVLSRKFFQSYTGDDFQVYRSLREINPSPYLFYFDCGEFRLFGSSPEAQIEIRNGVATSVPIAGTYRRSGDERSDRLSAERLLQDPKEAAEHAMLVDLARNDLSRSCHTVTLESYKAVQYYSHVIHLVSRVRGMIRPGSPAVRVLFDTFPAGTLSGAPKYRAMELLNGMEPTSRTFYGGAVGILGFDGSILHAIMIRTFLSKGGQLTFQAGSGLVYDSVPGREVEEVTNKLAALREALQHAEEASK